MDLNLYDTLTRRKREFVPLDWEQGVPEAARRVRMYVCGPTVYDFAHIGNARPIIVFDVLFRLLRHLYGADRVIYVRNITDVDDKINARAAERGVVIGELTAQTTRQFHEDIRALGVLMPDDVNRPGEPPVFIEPRATDHIGEMRTLIEDLVRAGNAYVEQDHMLFAVSSMRDYGRLSGRSLDEMIAGARVEVAPYKRDPMDFVLWKPSKPGEPSWPSPAGIAVPGRPGWHIECSAMSWKYLGKMFDIHGGGIDLVFPHHENEIAQSRSAFHTPLMARFWMHNGFLQVEGEKMAKSAGNFFTIRELLDEWPGDVLRFQMLMTHYRQPIDWTTRSTEQAADALDGFRVLAASADAGEGRIDTAVLSALEDDLNTPQAISELHRLAGEAKKGSRQAACDLMASCSFLGVDPRRVDLQGILKRRTNTIDEARIAKLIVARNAARAARNFREADRIRDELGAMGVVLKDSKDGTTWEMAR